MDERFGSLRQFLHQDIKVVTLLGESLCQVVDALRIRADTLTHTQQVGRGDMHITTFCMCVGIPCCRIQQIDTEEMTEDRLVDECLPLAHLETH